MVREGVYFILARYKFHFIKVHDNVIKDQVIINSLGWGYLAEPLKKGFYILQKEFAYYFFFITSQEIGKCAKK